MTTTNAAATAVPVGLGPELTDYLAGYQPKSLSAHRWAACRPEVLRLVTATEPGTTVDAKQTLAALCGFLTWTDLTMGIVAPAEVVTEPNVERWFLSLAGAKGEGTRANLRARVRRIVRVLAGDEARTKRSPRPPGASPYSTRELAELAHAAAGAGDLAAALALALVHGAVVPAARGAAVPSRDEARAVCATRALPDEWTRHLPHDRARVFTDDTWSQARRAADRSGLELLADRLRTTWLVFVLDGSDSLLTLVRTHELSRADLERAQPFLAAPAIPAAGRAVLRG